MYAVIDLEMCKVFKTNKTPNYRWSMETIQIGAALLDDNYEIVDTFMTYVKPQYGTLTTEIIKLTGIKNSNLVGAPDMETALKSLCDWLPENVILIEWSESDKYQIEHEIQSKNISFKGIDKLLNNWIDCQEAFSEKISATRKYNLQMALNISDIDYDSRIHDGLVDAINTALLFKKMKTEKVFVFNKYYIRIDEQPETLTTSIGSLFQNLKIAI